MSEGQGSDRPGNGTTARLLSGPILARNAVWNFAGMAAPMLIGIVAIPYLIEAMGKERFGLLAIIWMGVGYFSLFDFGLGRALTKLVSERLGRDQEHRLAELIWTALWLVVALGLTGMTVVMLLARPLVIDVLNVPLALHGEAVASFRLLAASLPIVIASSALIGILEAHQRFARIAVVRIPLGAMTFLAPVASLQISPSLVWATTFLIVARSVAMLAFYAQAAAANASLKRPTGLSAEYVRPLFSFGGWLTVSAVVGPLMIYFDRFLIAGLLSLTAVAYYTTPYEVLSRIQVLPQALLGVLFPAFAAAYAANIQRLTKLYDNAIFVLVLAMVPVMALLFLFAPELLEIWLGSEFRTAGAPVARWLAIGWLHVMVARAHSVVLQSTGRPDLLAKAHLGELLPYLALLWWLTGTYGIVGSAIAWFARALVDAVVLTVLAGRAVPALRHGTARTLGLLPVMWVGFAGLNLIEAIALKGIVAALCVGAAGFLLTNPLRRLVAGRATA